MNSTKATTTPAEITTPLAERRQAAGLEIVRESPELHWSKEIRESWRASVEAIVETGRLLVEAKHELPHGGFEAMVETKLPFGKRTAQMLMRIAEHPVLSEANHGALLPASWRTLAELSKLPAETLRPALAQHKITPESKRDDVQKIKAWAKRGGVEPQRRARREKPGAAEKPKEITPAQAGEDLAQTVRRLAAKWDARQRLSLPGYLRKLADGLDASFLEQWERVERGEALDPKQISRERAVPIDDGDGQMIAFIREYLDEGCPTFEYLLKWAERP